jgi:transcriptional regulator with XRE-family HTH domain
MIYDNAGRWIERQELAAFASLPFHERLKWVREELNKVYVGDYSVKKVAAASGIISHMGLYNMESNENVDSRPRPQKLQGLADFYQVPISIFSANSPDRFFLGKQYEDADGNADIRGAYYTVDINFSLRTPEGAETIHESLSSKMRHMDAEELLSRLQNELGLIQKRLDQQRKLDEAFDLLTKK